MADESTFPATLDGDLRALVPAVDPPAAQAFFQLVGDAIANIQTELGTNPSGASATVAARLTQLADDVAAIGAPGESAYQTWLGLGNTGTEADFIASLSGAEGPPGLDGADGADGAPGAPGADGADGLDGSYDTLIDIVVLGEDDYILQLSDGGKSLEVDSAIDVLITVPPNSDVAFPIGSLIEVVAIGTGMPTITAGAGVMLWHTSGLRFGAQYATATLKKRATDTWIVTGMLEPA